MSTTTNWAAVAALTAEHATDLPENIAIALVHTGDRDVLAKLAVRADLTVGTYRVILEHLVGSDQWALTTLAGNKALPAQAQQHLAATLVHNPGKALSASMRAVALRHLAPAVTDPEAVAILVRAGTSGYMAKAAWETRDGHDRPADAAVLEHVLLILAEREDLDAALEAADFLPRVHARVGREHAVRGDVDSSSPLAQAVHAHGLRHPDAYAALTLTAPHPVLLTLWACVKQRPAAMDAFLLDRVLTPTAAALDAGQPIPAHTGGLLYLMWDHLPADAKDAIVAVLRTGDLSTSPRAQWLQRLVTPPRPEKAAVADAWVNIADEHVYAEAVRRNWSLSHDELNLLWSRPGLPSETAIALLQCANTIGFEHAPALRPRDRAFAFALYTSCPGFLRRVEDVDLLLAALPHVLAARPDVTSTVTDVIDRLGERVHELPWPTLVLLADRHPPLAAWVADQVTAALADPTHVRLAPAVFDLAATEPAAASSIPATLAALSAATTDATAA